MKVKVKEGRYGPIPPAIKIEDQMPVPDEEITNLFNRPSGPPEIEKFKTSITKFYGDGGATPWYA